MMRQVERKGADNVAVAVAVKVNDHVYERRL